MSVLLYGMVTQPVSVTVPSSICMFTLSKIVKCV